MQMCGTCYYVAPAAWAGSASPWESRWLKASIHVEVQFSLSGKLFRKEIIGIKNGTICKGDGYGQEVDIWALGVLTYMLVSGLPPFNGKSHADVIWTPGATHMCLLHFRELQIWVKNDHSVG